jgi:hypothetical protein
MFLSLSILKLNLSILYTKYSDFCNLKQFNVTLQFQILQKNTRVRWKNANKDQCHQNGLTLENNNSKQIKSFKKFVLNY